MPQTGRSDVNDTTAEAYGRWIMTLSDETLCRALCRYDWSLAPERVLGWAMAQRGIDLGTALQVFFNGQPARFNYMPKRDVPADYHGVARVLDNICLRINSGFYLAYPGQAPDCADSLGHWLRYQTADRAEGRRGRWILDERILETIHPATGRADQPVETPPQARQTVWRALLGPLGDLGVIRALSKHGRRPG